MDSIKNTTKVWLITAFFTAVWAWPSMAQEMPDTLYTLDPIEVTATPFDLATEAAPFAVSHRTRTDADLNSGPALTLDRLTYTLPGLSVDSREHYALGDRVTMRGLGWRAQFGVRGVQVIMDGIPLTMADGQAVLDVVDPSLVRTVEVIRGPASTFWGNAAGGVLSLSTDPAGGASHRVRARQVVGSYGLTKTEVQATPALENHRLSAYASYLDQDGYRTHSSARMARAGLTGDFSLGSNRGVRVFGGYINMPRADSPGSLTSESAAEDPQQAREDFVENEAGKTQEQGQLGATYYDRLEIGTLRATAYGLFRALENPLTFAYITVDRLAGGGRLVLQREEGPLHWGFGLEGKLQHDDRVEFNNEDGAPGESRQTDQLETVYNQAAFGRAALPLGRFQLSAGLRFDWLRFSADDRLTPDHSGERTFQALSPSVGVSYRLERAQLYANLSTALEAPTTVELGNRPDGGGGFNPEIGPERTTGLETGVRGERSGGRLSYDLALFGMHVRDLLVPYQNENDETFYRNTGRTQHFGAEAFLEGRLPYGLSLGASYTYTHATFLEAQTQDGEALDGNRIPGVPVHLVGGYIEWRPQPLWITLDYEGTSAYPVDNENTEETEGYLTLNLEVSSPPAALGNGTSLQPFFAVNNLLDTSYTGAVVVNAFGGRYYEPAAGRHWRAGLTLQFN